MSGRSFDEPLAQRDRSLEVALLVALHDLARLLVEGDEALRVVLGAVALLAGCGPASDVAERAQCVARRRLLLHAPAAARLALAQAAEARPEPLEVLRPRSGEVPRLVRVRAQIVQFRQGQVDVLEAVGHDSAKRRPPAVERGAQRLDVGVPLLGPRTRDGEQAAPREAGRRRRDRARRGRSGARRRAAPASARPTGAGSRERRGRAAPARSPRRRRGRGSPRRARRATRRDRR